MADPFDRDRFAATVRRRLDGVSVRQAVDAFPALNVAMITRAKQSRSNLTVGSFLTLCKALRLRPMDFYLADVKRRRVTRKTLLSQPVTACVPCETRHEGDAR
ncbi:hypothetical protein EN904_12205 [Mesorhizobium sp. M7A.F.Ca.CA.001.07.2.1]|uniref:hypothetical protein n=2 Tax=Phyllobacteriaceae TaxID=69277 RepID=UPI000FC9D5E1|nr:MULTISPECIES: hypothetical protein [Mesorhizobium]RVB49181.1 hypothetical protein EN918_00770 [Mesorhizobium sp. M7A.F.Ca.CA.004.05.1.1]MCF6126046.1 hypothetical protein [Mesorhizobium ciceri]MCQ8813919.1 hypothetical protein [Mesorhizobium sp. SEMIA396]RUX81418.1 hypothetical protein EN983_04550 [Mesorhizobium sp. M7A.F.Ca.CA.004.08.2.1]RUX89442.1 hypothetical protein EN982_02580 [Mesorhizobium sp. M7A.F.Ca.CA.004.08.1.1]